MRKIRNMRRRQRKRYNVNIYICHRFYKDGIIKQLYLLRVLKAMFIPPIIFCSLRGGYFSLSYLTFFDCFHIRPKSQIVVYYATHSSPHEQIIHIHTPIYVPLLLLLFILSPQFTHHYI
jgi:hypothetical protein